MLENESWKEDLFHGANDDEYGHVSQRSEQIEREEVADSY